MRPITPLQAKTPFAISSTPYAGTVTSQGGLCAVSRALRSLRIPERADALLRLKQRKRGMTPGQHLEALILLHAAGGDCMDDMERLRQDPGLEKMLGFSCPSASCLRDFLGCFHDPAALARAQEKAQAQGHLAFIPEENAALEALGTLARETAGAVTAGPERVRQVTVDADATIIESGKAEAKRTYEGSKGYQPVIAVWAETGLILADEFRDGNVPAQMSPLPCIRAAFAAAPHDTEAWYFRGDSACYETELIHWLRDENRLEGPKGPIYFAISARMSTELAQALQAVPEEQWTSYGRDADGTFRQWADVDYVPSEKVEKKNIQPLRYVGLRLLKPQGDLFADGHDRRHYAIVTNRNEAEGGFVLAWHREKAGTVEHVHDELKNGLGAGQLPSGKFGANAAWFRIACIAHNVLTAIRLRSPDEALRTAKAKRLRFELFQVMGRFARNRRKITLSFAAPAAWIQRLLALFERFPLRTQPTG